MKLKIHWNPLDWLIDSRKHPSEKILRSGFWSRLQDTFNFLYGKKREIYHDGEAIGVEMEFGLLDYINPLAPISSSLSFFFSDIFANKNVGLMMLAFWTLLVIAPLNILSKAANLLLAGIITTLAFPFVAITHFAINPFVKKQINNILETEVDTQVLENLTNRKKNSKIFKVSDTPEEELMMIMIKCSHTMQRHQQQPPTQSLGKALSRSDIDDLVIVPSYKNEALSKELDSLKLYARKRQILYENDDSSPYDADGALATIPFEPTKYGLINAYISLNMFHTTEALEKDSILTQVTRKMNI